jgi:glutamyl/glutaminyl-tRNA synthetase
VLARKEIPASYHLCVVMDDATQGVTHVVRSQDLFLATSVHRLLQALLGLPVPAYHHHRLLLDADGRKLSKSTQSTSLRALRAGGATPADIRRLVGLRLRSPHERSDMRVRLVRARILLRSSGLQIWWGSRLRSPDCAWQFGTGFPDVARTPSGLLLLVAS